MSDTGVVSDTISPAVGIRRGCQTQERCLTPGCVISHQFFTGCREFTAPAYGSHRHYEFTSAR